MSRNRAAVSLHGSKKSSGLDNPALLRFTNSIFIVKVYNSKDFIMCNPLILHQNAENHLTDLYNFAIIIMEGAASVRNGKHPYFITGI